MRKFFKAVLMTSVLLTPLLLTPGVGFSSTDLTNSLFVQPYATLMPQQKKQMDRLTFLLEQKKVNIDSIMQLIDENPGITGWENQRGLTPLMFATEIFYNTPGFLDGPQDSRLAFTFLTRASLDIERREVLLKILSNPYSKHSFEFARYFVYLAKYNPHLIILSASEKGSVLASNLEKLKKSFSDIDPSHAAPGSYLSLTETQREQVDHLASLIQADLVEVDDAETKKIENLIKKNPSLMQWKDKKWLDPLNQVVDLLWSHRITPHLKKLLYVLGSRADTPSKLEALYWILSQQRPFSELELEGTVLVAHACQIDPATIKIHEQQKGGMFETKLRRLQEAYVQAEKVNQLNKLIDEKNPDITAIKKFVERDPSVVNFKNAAGVNPLYVAVYQWVDNPALSENLKNIVTYLASKTPGYLTQGTLIDLLHDADSERTYEIMRFFVQITGLLPSAIRPDQGSGPLFEKNLRRLQAETKENLGGKGGGTSRGNGKKPRNNSNYN